MFGIQHIKFDSMTYVIHFKNGDIQKEGRGLSFFYFGLNSSIVAIPMGSNDLPFIFSESTNDYQQVNIQGQISYKISNPKQLADVLDFTVNDNGVYKKNDIEKLNQRIINEAQTATSAYIHSIKLKDAIRSAKAIEDNILEGLKSSAAIGMLGIEILGVNILGISATPEMSNQKLKRLVFKENELIFAVGEPFKSIRTQTEINLGSITAQKHLKIESLMPSNGIIFSDGIETDFLNFNSGSVATIGIAPETARLVIKK